MSTHDGVPAGYSTSTLIVQNVSACRFGMVPERVFVLAALSNASPNGIAFNQTVIRWAVEVGPGERTKPAPTHAGQRRQHQEWRPAR